MKTLSPLLSDVVIDRSQTFKNLSIYPLLSASGWRDVNYALFSTDGDRNHVNISDQSNSHEVSNLKIEFQSDRRYLILDGDELQTRKDTYISKVTAMIPAGETITIPVYDLTQGRWIHESDTIQHSARKHFSKGTVQESKRSQKTHQAQIPTSDFLEVAVVRDPSAMKESETEDGSAIYLPNNTKLQKYLDSFTVLPSHIGAIFVVNGEVAGAHLFESEKIFASKLASLIGCYAAEPIRIRSNISKRKTKKAAKRFLSDILESEVKSTPTPGEGDELRFSNKNVIGGTLIISDRIAYLCAIPESATFNTTEFRALKERALNALTIVS